jgi:hypothetical protein
MNVAHDLSNMPSTFNQWPLNLRFGHEDENNPVPVVEKSG